MKQTIKHYAHGFIVGVILMVALNTFGYSYAVQKLPVMNVMEIGELR